MNKIIYFINVVVAVLLLLSFVLPFLPPKTFSILAVVNLGVSFLIILNVLFFIYWLIGLKKQFILSFFVLCIGYFSFGSLYKFSSSKKIENPQNFKVMNYNVRLFDLYDWIPESNTEKKIVDFIKNEAPEILSIQEYHPHKNIDLSFFKYKYVKLSGKKLQSGQAIYSQFPIVNSGSIEFPNTANNAIFADIVKGKDTIRIYNMHLQSLGLKTNKENFGHKTSEKLIGRLKEGFKQQAEQTEDFLKHQKNWKGKTIIAGDFNNTSYSWVYNEISKDKRDAFIEAGKGFGKTFDYWFPMRIDFILSDETATINSFKNYNVNYSDHFPIQARINW